MKFSDTAPAPRYLPEALILLLAAVVRFWRLDYHSFWFDEAVSLDWAEDSASYIWQSTFMLLKDKHPPGYYLLLHYWQNGLEWIGLAHNDVALRTVGALLGVLTVWGLLLLAQRLSGRTTGLLAGALAALGPVLVWYSQELRMFQPATTALVWAAYCLLRGWQGERRLTRLGWWLGMIVMFTAAVYSYLFSAFLLPAAGLTLVALWAGVRLGSKQAGDWGWEASDSGILGSPATMQSSQSPLSQSAHLRFLEGAIALTLTGLLFLPLARNAWLVNASEGAPGQAFMNFSVNMQRQLQVFTVWRAPWPAEFVSAAVAFFALLAGVGLIVPWPRGSIFQEVQQLSGKLQSSRFWTDQLWLWLWIGIPLGIGNGLLATSNTVFKEDRYFIFLAPFMLWAMARGVVVIGGWWRPAAWGFGAASLVLLAAALPVLWSPTMLREDWRAAAQYIIDYQQKSDSLAGSVFSHADYTHKALKWYLRPHSSEDALPLYFPYSGTLTPEAGDAVVAPPVRGLIAEGVETLWLVQSHLEGIDDRRVVESWLRQNFPVVTEQFPTGIQVTGYALQHRFAALPELDPTATVIDAELAPNLHLLACEVLTPELSAAEDRLHPPSGWVHVRLWWQATGAIDQDSMPSVQVVGAEGVWGERLYREDEVMRRDPPTQWPVGVVVRDEVDVNLNPVTPPGEYPVVVGLRDAVGGDVGRKVECGRVRIIVP